MRGRRLGRGTCFGAAFLYYCSMTVEIPESLAELLPLDPEKRTRSVVEGVVIGAFTRGEVSRGRAFELLGLDHWRGEAFFRERGLFSDYGVDDFKQDLGT